MNKQRCSKKVYPNEQWGLFHPHQCKKTAIVERDGEWYCKIHDPQYIKEKEKAATNKYNTEVELRYKRLTLEQTAVNACESVNPDNPQAVAESIKDMYEAIKRVLFITHNDGIGLKLITGKEDGTNRVVFTPSQLNEIGELLRKALSKAEGK